MVGTVKTIGRCVRIFMASGRRSEAEAPLRGAEGRSLQPMLLAIGDEGLGVGVELVERALDVGARAGDELLKLDAPMVAEVRPFGILPEVDRRHLGRLGQRLAKVGAELLVELVARHDAGAVEFAELAVVEAALLVLLRRRPGDEQAGAFLRRVILVALAPMARPCA